MKIVTSSVMFVVMSAIVGAVVINQPLKGDFDETKIEQTADDVSKSYILQGADSKRLNKLVDSVGGNVSREFPIINAVSAVLTPNQAEKIRALGNIKIQDDRTVVTSNFNANNPSKTKKSLKIDNYISEQIGASLVHEMGITGQGITVAVVDSGANMKGTIGQYLFNDTKGQQRSAIKYDAFKGTTTKQYNDDQNGHGTHVSGIIASSLKDHLGKYNGIAPDVNLLSVKAFDDNGESSYSKVLDALNWIFENRYTYKIRVVNMSLGANVSSYYWDDPINQAVMRLWHAGVVVVSSAGNNGEDMGITVPGNNPYVITVGATTDSQTPYLNQDDRLASFSSKGPTFEGFVKPEVVAYGARIASKMDERYFKKLMKLSDRGAHYSEISGTSQAAAMVSGIVALVLSNDPTLSPDDVKCRILKSASVAMDSADKAVYSPFEQGFGQVNAHTAVTNQELGCANTGLDIEQDLLGTNHFIGPTKTDSEGNYFIELSNGNVLTQGVHWSTSKFDVQGMHWGGYSLETQGLHWNSLGVGTQGVHWKERSATLEAAQWSVQSMQLKGIHWAGRNMDVQGIHWSEGELGTQGVHWRKGEFGLQQVDLNVEPIDPNTVIPMEEDGWN